MPDERQAPPDSYANRHDAYSEGDSSRHAVMGTQAGQRPAEDTGEYGHAERRANAEQQDVHQARGGSRQRGEDQRRQRTATRQAMDRTDEQRSAGERPGTEVDMRRDRGVRVDH